MNIGDKYKWKNQEKQLIYLGKNWSGNGYWHQFSTIEKPHDVWCEITDKDIHLIEKVSN